jgi:Zn-finger nucleic acid-binding protein
MKPCPDCGTPVGQLHRPGCDVEQCPRCGGQALSCGCRYQVMIETGSDIGAFGRGEPEATETVMKAIAREIDAKRLSWMGEWPGKADCREFGLWCRWPGGDWPNGGGPWQPCGPGEPGVTEDLNRLTKVAVWDPEARRYVRKAEGTA